ncbi:MAG: hypothetical protein QOJ89_5176, partial [bacterium]
LLLPSLRDLDRVPERGTSESTTPAG